MNHKANVCGSVIAIFAIVLVMGVVGDGDRQEAENQLKFYCQMVSSGAWGDYNGTYEQGKCPQEGQVMDEQEKQRQLVEAASVRWHNAKKTADDAVEAERKARDELVKAAFPDGLKEGTNTFDLAGKWKLKVQGKVSRTIDKAALQAVLDRMAEKFSKTYDKLISYKPELSVKEYKALDDKERKLFDNALTIKGTGENAPQVTIEEGKR